MEKGSSDREALREAMDARRRAGGATEDTDKTRQEAMAKKPLEWQKTMLEGTQAILTPEQYELYSKQEEERSALFRNGGGFGGFGGPRGGPPPGR